MRSWLLNPSIPIHDDDTAVDGTDRIVGTVHEALTPV
jgi:hypothetical protein